MPRPYTYRELYNPAVDVTVGASGSELQKPATTVAITWD
tara:strand:- start:404 stop:520 length:117 start_codon:yes stop_codon:yes gene_type:complete